MRASALAVCGLLLLAVLPSHQLLHRGVAPAARRSAVHATHTPPSARASVCVWEGARRATVRAMNTPSAGASALDEAREVREAKEAEGADGDAPRGVAVVGYRAPPEKRTWAPFTYSSPRERREASRRFARELAVRHGKAPDDPLPPLPPVRIALLGGPSGGKGTLAPMISAAFRARVLGVGQLLRGEIRAGTVRGQQASDTMASGELLPDALVLTVLKETISRSRDVFANGWLLDGFPRTVEQAITIVGDTQNASVGLRPDCVIVVERPDELIREFALGRMMDAATGAIYHPDYAPAPAEAMSRLVWRIDDTPAVVDMRIRDHNTRIEPIINAFEQAGVPVVRFDNARSELTTFAELAAFVEQVALDKLERMGGREAFRASVLGPRAASAFQNSNQGSAVTVSLDETDVAPICRLDESEEECILRYYTPKPNGQYSEPEKVESKLDSESLQFYELTARLAREAAAAAVAKATEDPLLEAVRRCNRFDRREYVPVLVDEAVVGWVSCDLVEQLEPQLALGALVELVQREAASTPSRLGNVAVRLAPKAFGPVSRSNTIAALVEDLVTDGTIPAAKVRNEMQDVWPVAGQRSGLSRAAAAAAGGQPLLRMERAATIFFGVPTMGAHVNGFVQDEETGRPKGVWIGKRSMSKATYPGLLDQMVAGGQPAGLSFTENMRKECAEEASLPPSVVASAVPTGLVSYCYGTRKGLSTKALVTFDLRMPPDLVPFNADGEVDEFVLMSVEEAVNSIRTCLPLWKPNAALVMIDFALRHGFITCDLPEYEELARGLRASGFLGDAEFGGRFRL
eukprot:CAMPEP_0180054174 /NCGR_PEP_ID=MMETSP0985-20121206/2693_1 /TAXON_ID=483367 /ORGANISM="non described non described, Strain CCMP 2436" /LENGTH=804 /DNA_ID=CAMNT_0021983763 /DNA_START=1 /DNA_END=2415 /DNA_ORIENTATION=+